MSKMGPLIHDLSNVKVPLLNHSKWSSNNISSVSNTSTNPDRNWNMCCLSQMRSYNRHTLVADPFEDGFGDFILKKQKMIELEKKVQSPVKSHDDKFAINITFSNPERCVTRESGSL